MCWLRWSRVTSQVALERHFCLVTEGCWLDFRISGHGNCSYKPKMLIWKDKGNLISELNMLGTYTLNRVRKQKRLTQERIVCIYQAENTFLKCVHPYDVDTWSSPWCEEPSGSVIISRTTCATVTFIVIFPFTWALVRCITWYWPCIWWVSNSMLRELSIMILEDIYCFASLENHLPLSR